MELTEYSPPMLSLVSELAAHSNTMDIGLRHGRMLFYAELDLNRCDESKCISSGPEAIVNRTGQVGAGSSLSLFTNNTSSYDFHRFDCYFKPNSYDAWICAEGYTGVPMETGIEPPRLIASDLFLYGNPVEQNYYTCCPPISNDEIVNEELPVRHCGDPKKVLNVDNSTVDFDPMPCNGEENGRIFPRPMKQSMPFYPDTYLCCDENLGTEEIEIENKNEQPTEDLLADICDESRCIGRSIGEFLPGYSCWGEGPDNLNPYACSDGYIAVPVDSVPPFFDEGQFLMYYTCCPPNVNAEKESSLARHCSDPIDYQPGDEEPVCNDPVLQYPRKQNKNGHYWHSFRNPDSTNESYICCDVELSTTQKQNENSAVTITGESYLDEVDCVISCDPDFQYDCWAKNKYGFLWPMGCDDPNGVFVEPKILGKGYAMGGTRFFYKYGCCKKGFGTGPFIQDDAFNKTVWPQLVLSALGVVASLLLIAALLLSFYYGDAIEGANACNTKVTTSNTSKSSTSAVTTTSIADSRRTFGSRILNKFRSGSFTEHRSTGMSRRKGKTNNSNGAYNAYLVYLAIPDLILNLFVVGMYGSYVNQKFTPGFSSYIVNSIFYERKTAFDMALILACSAANLYLNAIISYEVFTLLKNSHRRLRTPPPTFKRVGIQAAIVYGWAICIFFIRYFTEDVKKIPEWMEVTLYFMISAGIPILYLCYVCIAIWRRKLLPSMKGPLRVLALYFFRIIVVFLLLWLPGVLLLSFACNWKWDNSGDDYNDILYPVGLTFCSIQPICSTGMALTKPDVRVAILRFVRFSYCRKEEIQEENNGGNSSADAEDPKTNKTVIAGEREMANTTLTNSSIVVSSVQQE